jgi:hypothetical protein
MTQPGQRTGKPPMSPHSNLTATERTGTTKHGSAIWVLTCTCGRTVQSEAPRIKKGWARCPDCNPSYTDLEAERVLAVLPATANEIVERAGMTLEQVKYRLSVMRPGLCHIGKWRRSPGSGACQPVMFAGPGEDAPCDLKRRTVAENNRRYRKRVKKAIEKALAGGNASDRYVRHVARRQVDELVARTRAEPQNPFSALGL